MSAAPPPPDDFMEWRDRARSLLAAGIPPAEADWQTDHDRQLLLPASTGDLFEEMPEPGRPAGDGAGPGRRTAGGARSWKVPAAFLGLARLVWAHADPRRAGVLYRLLWRLTEGGERHLLEIPTDEDVRRAEGWRKSVNRDIHKLHAFVRFRLAGTDPETGRERYLAWFEPSSRCVRLAVPFFVRRFTGMDWGLLTPDECASWDGQELRFSPGIRQPADWSGNQDRGLEDLWRTYYRSIFNPARVKLSAMRSEMPRKYWKHLPEVGDIPELVTRSAGRVDRMLETPGREGRPAARLEELRRRHGEVPLEGIPEFAPEAGLAEIRQAALGCRACPLWSRATQTVFGTGPETARIMIVGEQPGDAEDLSGVPFTGPAGQLLRQTLRDAGLEPEACYLTNAVKHFKWEPLGPRRRHVQPGQEEIRFCRPWLLAELERVRPETMVLLGASAAFSLLGPGIRMREDRGLLEVPHLAARVVLTWHPSYLLRLPEGPARHAAMKQFADDLRLAEGRG